VFVLDDCMQDLHVRFMRHF